MIDPKMCLLSLFLMGDWMVSLPIHVNMCPLDITYLNTSLCIDLRIDFQLDRTKSWDVPRYSEGSGEGLRSGAVRQKQLPKLNLPGRFKAFKNR